MTEINAQPRRIAILLPRLSRYGGVEQFGWRLAEALAAEGREVTFICARAETAPPDGVRVVRVGRLGLIKAAKVLWFCLAAERARRRGNYDLCVGLGKTLRQDILRKSGGSERGFWRLHLRMYPAWVRPLKRLKRALFEPQAPLKEWIERRQLEQAKVVVTVSERTREWMLEDHPGIADKLLVVWNKPDLARFAPPEPEARERTRREYGLDDRKALLLAGSNFRLKGVPAAIEALARLPEDHVLLVAGGRKPGAFLRQARKLGVAERVRFLGAVSDMVPLYGAADVLVQPSVYDTCSNVVLEALASGLPVVASIDDGSSHFVAEDLVLRDPQDPAEIAAKVALALSRPQPPLVWPEDLPAGLEPFLELVRRYLGETPKLETVA